MRRVVSTEMTRPRSAWRGRSGHVTAKTRVCCAFYFEDVLSVILGGWILGGRKGEKAHGGERFRA